MSAVKSVQEAAIGQYAKQLRLPTLGGQFALLAAQAVKTKQSHLSYLEALLEEELEERGRKAMALRMQEARFPLMKTLEGFDFQSTPHISEVLLRNLSEGGYLARKEPIVFLGDAGSGKTHLATGLAVAQLEVALREPVAEVTELPQFTQVERRPPRGWPDDEVGLRLAARRYLCHDRLDARARRARSCLGSWSLSQNAVAPAWFTTRLSTCRRDDSSTSPTCRPVTRCDRPIDATRIIPATRLPSSTGSTMSGAFRGETAGQRGTPRAAMARCQTVSCPEGPARDRLPSNHRGQSVRQ